MLDYDFKILQPSEFECFSRDLLQAREDIFIESFADGRDKGIDLRFAYSKDKTCIVQCKRYKEWKELKGKLKEEVEKVKRLSPQRYILTTSVDLTVKQKDEVLAMFNPFILNGMDVLGKKDLNNLLEQNPEIEKNYHKLWLASTNILNTIINRATLNWSSFELEKIEKDIRLYVENESLNKALDVLKENHYVVISGIPGIGKTISSIILRYRNRLGGFYSTEQLLECKYFTEDLLPWFKVDSMPTLRKININDDSLKVLLRHPYFTYEQAKNLKQYRRDKGRIKDEAAFRKIYFFTKEECDRLMPYIEF